MLACWAGAGRALTGPRLQRAGKGFGHKTLTSMLSIPRDPVRLQVSEQGGVDPLGAAVSARTDKHPSGAKNPDPRWRCHLLGCSCSPSAQQGLPGRWGWGVPAARNTHQLYFFFVCFLPQIFFPGFCFYYYYFFLNRCFKSAPLQA